MKTKDVVFVRQQGGLARTAPGEDHVSAFISYGGPGSVSSLQHLEGVADNTKLITTIFSLKQAEDLGVIPNALTHKVSNEVIASEDTDPDDNVDDSVAAVAATSHGIHNIWHYHISEYFRINPTGQLWLGLFEAPFDTDTDAPILNDQGVAIGPLDDNDNVITQDGPDTADGTLTISYNGILDVQRAAGGKVRQAGIYVTDPFTRGILGDIQGHVNTLETEHMPLSVLLGADFKSVANFATNDVKINNGSEKNVSVVIGQDGGNKGAELYAKHGVSITCLGTALGAVSRASVHESIAWVQEFNMASSELDVLALANGQLLTSFPRITLDAIDSKGYIFLKKHIGISGSYFNDTHTGADDQSDYAFIENNRTLDKAIRGIRASLLPQLSSPLYVEANGNLSFDTIGYFESLASKSLEQMRIDGEVSNYDVSINPAQNVLSTSELKIQVSVIPVGVARRIEVSIGFALSVA